MSTKSDARRRSTRNVAGLLFATAALIAPAALAEPTDLAEVTKNPQKFLGEEVEMEGYCVKGGRTGDVLGYECTSPDGVYVDADEIEPAAAKKRLADDCAGGQCRATIHFVPHSYTTSGVIEADKTVTVFNTEKAKVSF